MGIQKQRRYCPEDDRMVLAEKETPNDLLHLVLSLLTVGVWILVWLALSVGSKFSPWRCPVCGAATRRRPPWGWKPQHSRED